MKDTKAYFRPNAQLDLENPFMGSGEDGIPAGQAPLYLTNQLSQILTHAQAEIGQIRNQFTLIQSDNLSLKKNLSHRIQKSQRDQQLLEEAQKEMKDREDLIRSLTAKIEELERSRKQDRAESHRAQQDLVSEMMRNEEKFRQRIFDLENQNKSLTELTGRTSEKVDRLEKIQAQLQEENRALRTEAQENEALRNERDHLKTRLSDSLRKIGLLQRDLVELRESYNQQTQNLAFQKQAVDRSRQQANELSRENQILKGKVENLKQELNESLEQNKTASKALEEIRTNLERLGSSIETVHWLK